jgi:uncharacterized phage protein (TIGR02218 family)
MTFDARERSQFGGKPIELFRFSIGSLVYFYTSADQAQTYLGDTYTTEPISRGAMSGAGGESEAGQLEVRVLRSNPIAAFFVPYSPELEMGLTIFRQHRGDSEVKPWWTGTVASGVFAGAECVLTCLPGFSALRRQCPRNNFSGPCVWELGSAQCGVTLSSFSTVAPVASFAGSVISGSLFSTRPNGYFNGGYVERANGERRSIVNHVGPQLTLLSPFTGLAVNEPLTAFAGCDRTEATCATKFANLDNHLGWARVPTRNPFTSGVS